MNTDREVLKTTNELLKELNKRSGVMIALLLRMVQNEKSAINLKEQVRLLDSVGLRPRDIAGILGKTPTHVSKELAGIRKMRKFIVER